MLVSQERGWERGMGHGKGPKESVGGLVRGWASRVWDWSTPGDTRDDSPTWTTHGSWTVRSTAWC